MHVYLISGSAADMEHLHSAVVCRVQKLKQASHSTADSSPAPVADSMTAATASNSDTSTSSKRKTDAEAEKKEVDGFDLYGVQITLF